jgi:hypothetical protein
MKGRTIWLVCGVLLFALAAVVLMGAQPSSSNSATIQDVIDLLTNEEGVNRLDALEEEVNYIHEKVDLIHSVAKRMLEEESRFFEQEEWTLSDIKYDLTQMEITLEDIKAKTDCIICP